MLVDSFDLQAAFEVHIRVLWGMLQVKSVPPPANETSMQFFHASSNDLEQIKAAIDSVATPFLVAKHQIQMLREASMGRIRVSRGMITLDTQAILTLHGALSKAGLSSWGPNLTQSHDALYNAANQYIAIQTFREVAVGPCYKYLQVNIDFVNDIGFLTSVYNHYAHYLSAAKFKREVKTPGRLAAAEDAKTISQRRRRVSSSYHLCILNHLLTHILPRPQLAETRMAFAQKNNFSRRYKNILAQPYAHSDDELDTDYNVFQIKTLEYLSSNANKFFRRVDAMMACSLAISGKVSQLQPRKLPKDPIASTHKTPPNQLPIDYYNPRWFNNLTPSQQEEYVNHTQVALLPNATESFIPAPNTHPAEKLSGCDFNKKYHEQLIVPYEINTCAGDSEEEGNDGLRFGNKHVNEEDMSNSIDLMAPSDGSDEEDKAAADNPYFEDGDFRELYEESEDGDHSPQEDSSE